MEQLTNQEHFIPVNITEKEINEEINLFKYIVRFSISYQLLLIVIAIITTILNFDVENMVISTAAMIGAVSFTMSRFINDNKRIPSKIEKKKLVWYSLFASWLVPIIFISPLILYSYEMTYVIEEMRKIDSWWFFGVILFLFLLNYFILQYFYGSTAKEYFNELKQEQPTKKGFSVRKRFGSQ